MFKTPFSFKGRIRRKEYLISLLIYTFICFAAVGITGMADSTDAEQPMSPLFLIIMIPMIWFGLAQGVKRSHDIGNSGWYILIPFYGLWLLFADSQPGENKWGPNPKGIGNPGFS